GQLRRLRGRPPQAPGRRRRPAPPHQVQAAGALLACARRLQPPAGGPFGPRQRVAVPGARRPACLAFGMSRGDPPATTLEAGSMDTTRHAGKVAVITGAGSGIGAATAVRMAAEGAAIVGVDVNTEGLEKVRAQIEERGGRVTIITADITDQAAVDDVVARTLAAHERIDVLANIAGIMGWFLPAHEVDDESGRRVMAVNVDGPMLLLRATLPHMMRQGAGAIVNVGSVGGLRGAAAGFAYTTSKHALV